jgi:hypothetical protein
MVQSTKRLHSTLGYVCPIVVEERELRDSADSARRRAVEAVDRPVPQRRESKP